MRRLDTLFLTLAGSLLAFAVTYQLNPKAPRYFPLERAWSLTPLGDSPGMGWYGRVAWALLAAGLGAVLVWLACLPAPAGEPGRELTAQAATATSALVLLALVGLCASIAWHELHHWGVLG